MYKSFAYIYEKEMDSVNYKNYYNKIKEFCPVKGDVLDIGCGNGKLASLLYKDADNLFLIDKSVEMLSIAQNKLPKTKSVFFINEDFLKFDFSRKFDRIYASIDILNYLTSKEELSLFFRKINKIISDNGKFFFDIRNYIDIEYSLSNKTFYYQRDNYDFVWSNFYDKTRRELEFEISMYFKKGETYLKKVENHFMKAWICEEIEKTVMKADLKIDKYLIEKDREYFVVEK